MSLALTDILGILIIYQSGVFLFSMLFTKRAKPLFSKMLMIICLAMILHFGHMLLQNHGIMSELLLGPFFGLLYGPLYYAYTRSLIAESLSLKGFVPHFIPAFMLLALLAVADTPLKDVIGISGLLVSIHFIAYLLMALKRIYSYRKRLLHTASSFYRISLYWLEAIIYLQLTILGVALLESYFQAFMNTNAFILVIYFFVLALIHCFYYLGLKQVRLFKGLREEGPEQQSPTEYALTDEVFGAYLDTLTRYMESEKPYLEYDITLQELSDKLGISPRNLSHVINKHFKRNYYSFINHYRLELAKKNLATSDLPIKEIMYDSGFSNKATFYSLFKKDTGLTPVQFRNSQKM
ncbi:MAG TPA: AraC family transcriptional regulator [Robiginitalea sp.]|nr:AraC family transcriptional regulator [Robiginitalea sp.]